jgi:hypothetical protein
MSNYRYINIIGLRICGHSFILRASSIDSVSLYTVVVFKLLSEKWYKFYTHRRDNIAHTRPTTLVFLSSRIYLRKEDSLCWRKSELSSHRKHGRQFAIFEVLTVVMLKIMVVCDVTPYRLVNSCWLFEEL